VDFLNKIWGRILLVFQFILVFLFILFEEIIWEGIAKPIYDKFESLHLVQKVEMKIKQTNNYVVLAVFTILLLAVEGAGILAGLFFVQGHILLGLILYITKIPIAAFVFWLFKISKSKLLSFAWFKWSYEKLTAGINWLKEREIYKEMMDYMAKTKAHIKSLWRTIKAKYFSKKGSFVEELKSFYHYIKNFKKHIKQKKEEVQND
jgi:hypothetical protein